MASVTSTATINLPPEKVFNYVVSVENHKAWQASILDAKVTPPGPPALGSIYHYTTDVMGRKYESQMQISGFEPNRKWAVKTTGVPRPVETIYSFEPASTGTKLTISMELTPGAYPAAAEGMVKQQMQKSLDEQCHRIKQMVEK